MAVVIVLMMGCGVGVGCSIIGAGDHVSNVITATRFKAVVRVVSRFQMYVGKSLRKYVLKDERNSEFACHLWLVQVWREEAPLGNLSWIRHLVLRDTGERDGAMRSEIRDWCLLVGGFIEVGALDCNVHRRVGLVVVGSIWRLHLHCLELIDLRIVRTAVIIWMHVRAGGVAVGRLSRRSWSSMPMSLSERIALLRH